MPSETSKSAIYSTKATWDSTQKEAFEYIVKKCILQFTTQRTDLFYKLISDYLVTEITEKTNTVLYKNHSELLFIANIIDDVFCNSVFPALSSNNYEHLMRPRGLDYICRDIALLCFKKLSSLFMGLPPELIIALSGESYESGATQNLSLALLPHKDEIQKCDSPIIFSEDNQSLLSICNVKSIRKQLNMSKECALAIHKDANGEFRTLGLIPNSEALKYPRFHFLNRLDWCFCIPIQSSPSDDRSFKQMIVDSCRMRYHGGTPMFPITQIHNELESKFKEIISVDSYAQIIAKTVIAADSCRHGAVLIFSDPNFIRSEALRLAKNGKCGITLEPPVNLIDNGKIIPSFYRLTDIDGALLIDFSGICYACGVILDGIRIESGNAARGARFNSTKAYVESRNKINLNNMQKSNFPIIGIVKSEDGMLDIFHTINLASCTNIS